MAENAAQSRSLTRGRAALDLDFNVDREAAFRRARRHSILVRSLRVLFPVASVALFASYGLFVQTSFKLAVGTGKVGVDALSISTEALVARNPRYEGFDKQGGRFVVHARTAEQDIGQKQGPVRLKTIDGQLIDAGKQTTDLKARSGTYDSKSNVLELYERIDVVSSGGMTAELTRATVYAKEGRITSDQPVLVRLPTGIVRGRTMELEQKAKKVTFANGVSAQLKQDQPKDKAATVAKAAGATGGAGGGLTASDAPVDITSATLVVDDNARLAVFSGNVVAIQGDSKLQAPQLEISYEGQAAPGAAPKSAPADPNASSRLKRLVARNDIVLTRGLERATARTAEFDATSDRAVLIGSVVMTSGPERQATSDRVELDNKNDNATLIGNVVVTQVKNVLKGRRLHLDRKAGTMALASPAEQGLAKGRISARLYQADAEAAGQKQKAAAASEAANKKSSPLMSGMRADPSQPIDIEADTLDVNDRAKTAIFRGNVRAVQGDYTILTEELVVTYSGEAGIALGAPTGSQATAAAEPKQKGAGAQLQKVVAPRRAHVVAKDGRKASGNSAEFDTKANIITLLGDVMMSQDNSTMNGPKAVLDMVSGTMQMEQSTAKAPATAGVAPAVSTSQPKQRIQVLLYPNEIKEKSKAGAPAVATPGAAASPGPAAAPAKAAQPAPAPAATPPAPAELAPPRRAVVPAAPNASSFPGTN